MMQCAKEIDSSAGLMTWKEKDNLSPLNGNEVKLMDDNYLAKYIDIPTSKNIISKGVTYYSNVIRVKTEKNVKEFVDIWNNKKYEKKENSPFKKGRR